MSETAAIVIVAAGHTHARQRVGKGTSIHVDAATAQWLIDNDIGIAAIERDTPEIAQETPEPTPSNMETEQ